MQVEVVVGHDHTGNVSMTVLLDRKSEDVQVALEPLLALAEQRARAQFKDAVSRKEIDERVMEKLKDEVARVERNTAGEVAQRTLRVIDRFRRLIPNVYEDEDAKRRELGREKMQKVLDETKVDAELAREMARRKS